MDIVHVSLQYINDSTLGSFSCTIWVHVAVLIIEVDKVDTSCRSTVNTTQIDIEFQTTTKVIRLEVLVCHRIAVTLTYNGMVVQSQSDLISGGIDI